MQDCSQFPKASSRSIENFYKIILNRLAFGRFRTSSSSKNCTQTSSWVAFHWWNSSSRGGGFVVALLALNTVKVRTLPITVACCNRKKRL